MYDKNIYDTKVDRWKLLILEYDVSFEYIEGKNNQLADYLSRNNFLLIFNSTKHKADLVDIKKFHKKNGHPGIVGTYNTLKKLYSHNNLLSNIKQVIKYCKYCQLAKTLNRGYGELKGTLETKLPLKDICTDVVGPFKTWHYKTNLDGKLFIITMIDRCTKFTRVFFNNNCDASAICKVYEAWKKEFNSPSTILSDQGKGYIAMKTHNYCKKNNIKQIFTSIYNPTGNSIAERTNKIINECMRIYRGKNLSYIKLKIENRINNIFKRILGCAPIEAIKHFHSINSSQKIEIKPVKNYTKIYKKKKRIPWTYKIGDKVCIKNKNYDKGNMVWCGPYKVIQVSNDKQRIQVLEQKVLQWYNIKHVKPFWGKAKCYTHSYNTGYYRA